MKFPLLVTNFKTYESATGEKALVLAKIHEKIAKKYGVSIGVAVQAPDIRFVASQVNIPVFSQHFDLITPGQNTGFILPEAVKQAGAFGSLLNHAEHRIPFSYLSDYLIRASQLGLFTMVCAKDVEEAKNISALKPDCVAIEPPELIGGNVSVSTASPEIIQKAVQEISEVPVFVGAGVKTGKDVEIALKLGTKGILLASGITQAEDPESVLEELVKAMV